MQPPCLFLHDTFQALHSVTHDVHTDKHTVHITEITTNQGDYEEKIDWLLRDAGMALRLSRTSRPGFISASKEDKNTLSVSHSGGISFKCNKEKL